MSWCICRWVEWSPICLWDLGTLSSIDSSRCIVGFWLCQCHCRIRIWVEIPTGILWCRGLSHARSHPLCLWSAHCMWSGCLFSDGFFCRWFRWVGRLNLQVLGIVFVTRLSCLFCCLLWFYWKCPQLSTTTILSQQQSQPFPSVPWASHIFSSWNSTRYLLCTVFWVNWPSHSRLCWAMFQLCLLVWHFHCIRIFHLRQRSCLE